MSLMMGLLQPSQCSPSFLDAGQAVVENQPMLEAIAVKKYSVAVACNSQKIRLSRQNQRNNTRVASLKFRPTQTHSHSVRGHGCLANKSARALIIARPSHQSVSSQASMSLLAC